MNDLPATFRDAIHVAHTLGFRWFWIDALCIIQDSEEDQETEINKVDQTFQSSTLTLYAVAGDHVDAGLSMVRGPLRVKPCRLDLKTTIKGRTVEGEGYFQLDWRHTPATLPSDSNHNTKLEQVPLKDVLLLLLQFLHVPIYSDESAGKPVPSLPREPDQRVGS